MSKEWCTFHNCGKCEYEGTEPSMSIIETLRVELPPTVIELTDPNSIMNYLLMYGHFDAAENPPAKITVTIPESELVERRMCGARNSRSKQSKCSHYK